MFLAITVENILQQMRGETEVIVIADGNWPEPPILDNDRVRIVYHSKSIGQRAATNEGAKLSKAKYIMKCDAHCSFDEGFDVKLMADSPYDWTIVPRMYNLHAFNWKCKECGNETYQGPTPTECKKCNNSTSFERVIYWKEKRNPTSDFMRFDSTLHFQYWGELRDRPESKADLAPTMSLIGACWFMHRERYWELDGMDEKHGSWGQMGTEIACKSWLSGGALMTNRKTWFAHMFRTQGGDFGFPYDNPGRKVEAARQHSKDLWFNNKWPKAKHDLGWLINKFWPIPGWTDEDRAKLTNKSIDKRDKSMIEVIVKKSSKGIVYYTDFRVNDKYGRAVRKQIDKCCPDWPIVSVSLNQPLDWGSNVVLEGKRGYLMMFKQILAGIEANKSDVLFMCEHDVLYHPDHFKYNPERDDLFYYNENRWFVNAETGHALFYHAMSTSGMCAKRDLLLEHYTKRVERVEREGYTFRIGFEPGGHKFPRGIDNYGRLAWWSDCPNIDIRHGKNLTISRWTKDEFRNKRNLYAWTEAGEIPCWGKTKDGGFEEIVNAI
jgi:glycosyltransferase involved in cell wall biosynthesis